MMCRQPYLIFIQIVGFQLIDGLDVVVLTKTKNENLGVGTLSTYITCSSNLFGLTEIQSDMETHEPFVIAIKISHRTHF